MTNKRPHAPPHQANPPRAPSLDPDTGQPVQDVAPSTGDGSAPSPPPAPPAPPDPPGPSATPATAASVEESGVEAWKDRHLRLAAEYDNFRKRTTKERAEVWSRAQADLVSRLADALDDLSRFAHIEPAEIDSKTLHDGVDLVERKIWKELEAAGVTRIDQAGVPFDPHVHEAVTTQPAAKPEQDHTVGQVVQPGYKMRDTLLRPARVIVLTWQGQ
jgi:molecular chaperone GrpE